MKTKELLGVFLTFKSTTYLLDELFCEPDAELEPRLPSDPFEFCKEAEKPDNLAEF